MKKIILFSALLAAVILAVWYFTKKKATPGSVENENEPKTEKPPTDSAPIDPFSGDGATAVRNQIKSIVNSNAYGRIRKNDAIGNDLFSVITNPKVKDKIRQTALAGRVDDYSIILLPESFNPDFQNQLVELQRFTQSPSIGSISSFGKDKYGERLLSLTDFSRFDGGFKLFDRLGNVIDNNAGYGECPGGANSDRKNACIKGNMVKLSNELNRWAAKMITENKKINDAIFNEAIANLKKAGWVIIGF